MRARALITLREGVLDPQGKAVERSLHSLGFAEAADVRVGKVIELDLGPGVTAVAARARVEEMCRKLLANTVIEDFRVELQE